MRKEYDRLKRRPLLMPVWLSVLAGAIVMGAGLWMVLAASTTVLVIVPAEAAERARVIATTFAGSGAVAGEGIDALIAADSAPSRAYAERLGAALGLAPELAIASDPDKLAERALGRKRGGRILVVAEAEACHRLIEALRVGVAGPHPGEVVIVAVPRFSRPAALRLTLP